MKEDRLDNTVFENLDIGAVFSCSRVFRARVWRGLDYVAPMATTTPTETTPYAAKPQSYPGAIVSMLRLSNPAADLPDSGTFPGFAQISVEQLLTMDPDFLFTITPAPEPAPRLVAAHTGILKSEVDQEWADARNRPCHLPAKPGAVDCGGSGNHGGNHRKLSVVAPPGHCSCMPRHRPACGLRHWGGFRDGRPGIVGGPESPVHRQRRSNR